MRSIQPLFPAVVLAVALASCAGGPDAGGFTPPGPGAISGAARLTIALPPISPAGAPIDWAAKPNRLSSATRSVAGSIGGFHFGPIALSGTRCTATQNEGACSIVVNAPNGTDLALKLATYATKNATGPRLAQAASTVTVYGGQANYIAPRVFGIARQIAVQPVDLVVRRGRWSPEPLAVYGVDAAGAPIPSNNVVDRSGSPIGDVTISLAGFAQQRATVECCGPVSLPFAYDGLQSGTETFTASARGFRPQTTAMHVQNGVTEPATLIAGSSYSESPDYVSFVAQFDASANGDSPPARTFLDGGNTAARPFGEDAGGNYWIGNTHYSNDGRVIGALSLTPGIVAVAKDANENVWAAASTSQHCNVLEYPAGKYGSVSPIRTLADPACSANEGIASDLRGDVFVALDDQAHTAISEYAPGETAPFRVIPLPVRGEDHVAGIDVDARGVLYALTAGESGSALFAFAPGDASVHRVLANVKVQSFAVDDGGGIYARVYSAAGPSLEYFPPGSATPTRVIRGTRTMLYDAGGIAVPRG